jgi:flagellar biosynthesis chaperone FliJ
MTRRLETLAMMGRLHDRRLSLRAAELAPLQDRASGLAAERAELERRRQEETAVALTEAMPYTARFLLTLRRERDRLSAEKAVVDRAVEAKREEVLEAWRDLRSNTHLREAMLARLLHDRRRAEQAEADERGVMDHARAAPVIRRQAPRG